MMINNLNSNICFSGRLNVFYFDAQNNNVLKNALIDSSSILSINSVPVKNKVVNVLFYSSPEGIKKCCSLNLFPNCTESNLRSYFARQINQSNRTGNVIDVLL